MDYHTLLARLGEGSAHPGGFQATKELIGQIGFPRGTRVLEVGCGTGRTACYLASLGCDVTAIDRNKDMIRKATHRATISGLPVRIVQADASSLPFPHETFDVVFTESVTAFTQGSTAIREYWRVLKPQGVLYDRELAFARTLTAVQKKKLQAYYGLHHMRTVPEWLKLLSKSSFHHYSASHFVQIKQPVSDNDPLRVIDHELFTKPDAVAMMMKNERLMSSFANVMGSIVITAWKA
ncbi:methyltransferase family protein [Paenibacillus cellulosilyticus]|uniref:Methyltransferase family protein n=1 Tax=Paenibacillus cellulosilyticus TaxID=375489 RepID=A0A2V2YT80_9BACL|nr:class I SAM-dependent methyltransferase [Paenibacillus cellulosilyticus]PWW02749.1 methyltransferase family protein [Paenibacillus cellulosilyticus]QKS45673.1 class I SAM-dependent methyltransferase [Paenibacillus cellulosilyticus]